MTDPDSPRCPNGHKSGVVDRDSKSYPVVDGTMEHIHDHYQCDECNFEVVVDKWIHSRGGDGKRR